MKALAFAALSMFSVFAAAGDLPVDDAGHSPLTATEQYNRHKGLDIAKVTSVKTDKDPAKTDGLVKNTMIYVDGSGHQHSLEYTTMGYGRQNSGS